MADCIASQEYQHGTLFQGLWLSANLLPDLDVSPHYEKYTVNSTVHVICGLNPLPAGNCMSATKWQWEQQNCVSTDLLAFCLQFGPCCCLPWKTTSTQ